jgi:restriction system protein
MRGRDVVARSRSLLDDLVVLPWWFSTILAAIAYAILKYVLPAIGAGGPVGGFFLGVSKVAPVVAALFLMAAGLSAVNAWRKGKLLDRQTSIESIRLLTWREFEELVGEMYRRQGCTVLETGGGGADGGVDVILKKGGDNIIVQCKQWKATKVGVKVVRELYGVMTAERATQGTVLTSGEFTREAKDFARGKPLQLVSGTQLARMIEEVRRTPSTTTKPAEAVKPAELRQPVEAVKSVTPPFCPRCGKEMVLRTARKGAGAGQRFWGCRGFPECRGTRPFEA